MKLQEKDKDNKKHSIKLIRKSPHIKFLQLEIYGHLDHKSKESILKA